MTAVNVKTNYSGMRDKLSFLFIIIFLVPFKIFGQNNFVEFDSLTSVGIKVVDCGDRSNSSLCQVKNGEKILKYSPYEVIKYGFKDGRVYVSKEIHINDTSVQRVFLERLVNDKTTLYYYNGKAIRTFFIEKDSTLFIELSRNDYQNNKNGFHEKLFNITSDCRNVSDATKLVLYNKRSLSKLIQRYNNCELKPFPFFKYGLTFGYGFTKLSPSSPGELYYPSGINFKYDPGYILGLFIDCPILASDLSFRSELLYSKNGYSYDHAGDSEIIDLVINTTSLSMPVLLRYTLPTYKVRPFFELGGIYTYNIRNEGIEFKSSKNNDIITVLNASYSPLISDIQVGYSFGGGVQFSLGYRNILSLGLRYNNLYRVSDKGSLNEKTIHLISSISF